MNRVASILLSAAAVLLIAFAGGQNSTLVAMREEYRLDSAEPLQNAPPAVAFTTVVLGGFRGLIADGLWLRATYLQDKGRFFELVQLADWITKLEPRCTEIWAFHAWNMAYNVSVMMPKYEDRWRWVCSGMQLLRDEGLRYNPGDPDLYCELGWLYQFKIGGRTDQAHEFYKRKWAEDMQALLGGPAPDYATLATKPDLLRRMKEEYKLEPDIMHQVDDAYGPLDWRLADTHALYWAWRGKMLASRPKDIMTCDRMIYQAMTSSFFHGRLSFNASDDTYSSSPHPELLPGTLKALDYALRRHPDETVETAYVNFLQGAIYVLGKLDRVFPIFTPRTTIRSRRRRRRLL